jgi:D-glycero-D-manno-heptose 1,7-bisphosphate phosphatase
MRYNHIMKAAIFLDRDGVIIENRKNYVRSWEDVVFIPDALSALRSGYHQPYQFILITNQSAIGRGLISLTQANKINQRIKAMVEESGGRLDGVYMCPHTPQDACHCRKPQPGMLLQAATQLHIDLTRSYMIGDALSDLGAGKAAHVQEVILVRTGRGTLQETLPEAQQLQPFRVFDTLSVSFDYIFSQPRSSDSGSSRTSST